MRITLDIILFVAIGYIIGTAIQALLHG